MNDDIKSVLYKGNLYWMPKLEVNELISEFVKDLNTFGDFETYPKENALEWIIKIKEKWEEMLK